MLWAMPHRMNRQKRVRLSKRKWMTWEGTGSVEQKEVDDMRRGLDRVMSYSENKEIKSLN